jgi:hypothetical protein
MEKMEVQVWIRDGWSVAERTVRDDSQAAGTESPIVYVFVPRLGSDELAKALASFTAADETLKARQTQTTPEGIEARNAMQSRRESERGRLTNLVQASIHNARVFLGGGSEITSNDLQGAIREAVEAALSRLFPRFEMADDPRWGTVITRAKEGAADALGALDYHGDVDRHPVCREVRDFIGGAGKRGSEIQKHFMGPPYGWTRDAVDGALLALVAGGFVRAAKSGQALSAKQIVQGQIGVSDFISEGITVSAMQRIGVHKLISDLGLPVKPGEEMEALPLVLSHLTDFALASGGEPPLPSRNSTAVLDELKGLSGNEQFVAVYNHRERLLAESKSWSTAKQKIAERKPQWDLLQELLSLAPELSAAGAVATQAAAIKANRSLLDEPNPVAPLLSQLTAALRLALQLARQAYEAAYMRSIDELKATDAWSRLSEAEAQRILKESGMSYTAASSVATDEALLKTLRETPLSTLEAQTIALAARLELARAAAAQQLEPTAVTISPKHATLKSTEEADHYLAELREEILGHIKSGHPVIL